MDNENQQWDLADQELNNWLNGDTHKSNIPLSEILKSAFLTFRQKQIERFTQNCIKAFEYYIEQERISAELVREPIFKDSETRFRIVSLSESEKRARTSKENKKVIDGILSGNQGIFNDLYEYEFPKIVRLVTMNSMGQNDAQDIFQDGIVVLIERVFRKDLDLTCSVSTYLYSICRNLLLEQIRKKQKIISLNDPYNHLNPDITFIEEKTIPDVFDSVNKAIESLGDPCRQLLEFFYYQKLSWGEIANLLGYSTPASARNQKYKCLEKIRNAMSCGSDFNA